MKIVDAAPQWKRLLIKLSGEALMGRSAHGLDAEALNVFARDIAEVARAGREIAIVVGGGNFFRGIQGAQKGIERARGDSIGMLATVMNALALEQALEQNGLPARALSAVPMPSVCQSYSRQIADHHLRKGRAAILAGGTGNPFFTTDTGAALRAAELGAHALMKATQVDGVYTADPKKHPDAKRYDHLTYDAAIEGRLGVMDTAAFALAQENNIPILVFSLGRQNPFSSVLKGESPATLVSAARD